MPAMPSRRSFLQSLSAGLAASVLARPWDDAAGASAGGDLARPFKAGLGLQLYSLRHRFKAGDVDGALALTQKWGFTAVETGVPAGMTAAAYSDRLKAYRLAVMGTGVDFKALASDPGPAIDEAHVLGAPHVMCAWIPHEKTFTLADVDKAAAAFNAGGKKLKAAGLTFMYHIHGYEFVAGPSGQGTLFDALAQRTDPDVVKFEMDVFWAVRGGADPVQLFGRYPGRFVATHVKDIAKGTPLGDSTGTAPEETNVPIGQGHIAWADVFRAAEKAGVSWHIIEDESPTVEQQVPVSLRYLADLKL
jgi:sugar phosphate isomerase/epimerase